MSVSASTATEDRLIYGYGMTSHARDQMDERFLDVDDVALCLEFPTYEIDRSQLHASYWDDRIGVYVNEKTHTILAVVRQGEVRELEAKLKKLKNPARPPEPEPVLDVTELIPDPREEQRRRDREERERRKVLKRLGNGCTDTTTTSRRPLMSPPVREHAPLTVERLLEPQERAKSAPGPIEGFRPSWSDGDSSVLSRIHPALHAEITRQVAGDYSKLVIYSPTRVLIDVDEEW